MELSRDVTFQEDVAYRRLKHSNNDNIDSQELLVSPSPPAERETMEDDIIEPIDPVVPVVPVVPDPIPRDIAMMGQKRRPTWVHQTLHDAEGHAAPCLFRESKRSQRYGCYVTLMRNLLNSKPATYEEASKHHCWRDAMTKEYESIRKNDA